MKRIFPHIGLRAIKTALAIALALSLSYLLGGNKPTFTVIGAVNVMGRTLNDSFKTGITQFFGTAIGFIVASLISFVTPDPSLPLWTSLATLIAITLCIRLKLHYALGLSCIVAADVCLYTGALSVPYYGFIRLLDTSLGIAVALLVNIVVKPYSNRQYLQSLFDKLLQQIPSCTEAIVLHGQYPSLKTLDQQLVNIRNELHIFETQRFGRKDDHGQMVACLHGCEQLAGRIVQSLHALSSVDEVVCLEPALVERLEELGIRPKPNTPPLCGSGDTSHVINYHLRTLLDACVYLREYLALATPSAAAKS